MARTTMTAVLVLAARAGALSSTPPQCGGLECTTLPSTYTKEQPSWQPGEFKLSSKHTFEDTWGFVDSETYLPVDHRGYEELQEQCGTLDQFETPVNLKDYGPLSTVNYFEDTDKFMKFQGIDMVPENKKAYIRGAEHDLNMDFQRKTDILKERAGKDEDMKIYKCKIPAKDEEDGTWHVQRVGPFYSTGGYDWWQVGWQDVAFMSEALAKFPKGVDVTRSVMAPVDENGNLIGHPPIHIHHVHSVEAGSVRSRNRLQVQCFEGFDVGGSRLLNQGNCYNSSLFFEQHGDYQCQDQDDGLGCFMIGDHMPRRLTQVIDVEGDLNDVRPNDSPVMKWYYQFALKWKPADAAVLVTSMMTIMAPGAVRRNDQLTRVATYPTPTDKPSFLWYQGQMWASGSLQRNKLHAHNAVFESSNFFAATPKDLGLEDSKFLPANGYGRAYDLHYTDELGFENNEALLDYLFKHLDKSQNKWDDKCEKKHDPDHDVCSRPRPKLVCVGMYDAAHYDFFGRSFGFDRRTVTWCQPWDFKEGDNFLVTSFNRKLDRPVRLDQPDTIPTKVPGHTTWGFWYRREGYGHSAFGRIMCNQQGIFFDAAVRYGITELFGMGVSSVIVQGVPSTSFWATFARYAGACVIATVFLLVVSCVLRKTKKA